ncbi:MAG: molecular chaperone DnaK [Nitrososphaerales archaeon]
MISSTSPAPESNKAYVLGIDLGTTNSAAAVYLGHKPVTIPSSEGQSESGKMFPSVVGFTEDNSLLVGSPAKLQLTSNLNRTILEIKRKMGTNYKVQINRVDYTPQQISAFILQKIKRDAQTFLGREVKKAVITVPAYFNDNQRQATLDAGAIAGLEVLNIINEPTAACLAYGLDKISSDEGLRIMVFTFGGGTHDVTTMELTGKTFRVIATSGDTLTGGTDIDTVMIDRLLEHFLTSTNSDLRKSQLAMARLKEAAEKAKIKLSTHLAVNIELPFIAEGLDGSPIHLDYTMTRAELEELSLPIVKRVEATIKTVLYDSRLGADEIDRLILIGGQTRMPLVRRVVERFVSKVSEEGVDPMECVALGAAIHGAILNGELNYKLLDVTPLSLGIENASEMVTKIIERNMPIPAKRTQIFTTARDNQSEVTIHILQGERAMASDNFSIGIFDLEGIPKRPRGVHQIEVSFDLDANGILHVSATEKSSGIGQRVTITGRMKLPDEEKRRMIEDAEMFAAIDRAKREEAELRKTADRVIYHAEKVRNELILPREERKKLEESIVALTAALQERDPATRISLVNERIIALTDLTEEILEIYQIGEGL